MTPLLDWSICGHPASFQGQSLHDGPIPELVPPWWSHSQVIPSQWPQPPADPSEVTSAQARSWWPPHGTLGRFPTVFDLHDGLGQLARVPYEIRGAQAEAIGPGAPILADGLLAEVALEPLGTQALPIFPRATIQALTWKSDPRTRVL